MSGTGDPDYHYEPQIDLAPRQRGPLVTWLQKKPETGFFREDDWRELCRNNSPVAIVSLLDLAAHNIWPVQRWTEALNTWSSDNLVRRSWKWLANCVSSMPDPLFLEIVQPVGWWLHEVGKQLVVHEPTFISLCERVLKSSDDEHVGRTDDAVLRSMSHPVGQVTQALLHWWFSKPLNDNDGLPATIAPIFTRICDTNVATFRHGRTLLASNVVALFRVDPSWTQANLLPLFDWQSLEEEAFAAWMGYLWSPRLYKPLLIELKKSFLDSARHYERFGDARVNYASMLTLVALDATDLFSRSDLQRAVRALPVDGLVASAQAVHRAMDGADGKQSEYWRLVVRPFLTSVWPKSIASENERLTETLARMAVAAEKDFPDALETVALWLRPITYPYQLLKDMNERKIGERFPVHALRLLVMVINKQHFAPPDLKRTLEQIVSGDGTLSLNLELQSLEDFCGRQ